MTLVQSKVHHIVGEPTMVAAALHTADQSGRLISLIDGQVLPDGRVHVRAELQALMPKQSRSLWQWFKDDPTRFVIAGLALCGLVAAGLVVYLVVSFVMWLNAVATAAGEWLSINGSTIFGVFVLILLLLLFGGGSAACAGIHCGGCRR